jgi:hypothetical protein
LFPGSEVAKTDADEYWFLRDIISDYAHDQVLHSMMCYSTFIHVRGREERGSSLVRNMHAWGQDKVSNNAISRIYEIFVFVLFITSLARMSHIFISNPVLP